MAGKLVVIDAGHGGRDPGAVSCGMMEKDVALRLALAAAKQMRAHGWRVALTRESDRTVSIAARVRAARALRPTLFLSIHLNAGPETAQGLEAYVREGDERSRALAERIQAGLARRWPGGPPPVRGVKPDTRSGPGRLGVLRGVSSCAPSVLLEAGFLTSRGGRHAILSPGSGAAIGDAVAEAAAKAPGG